MKESLFFFDVYGDGDGDGYRGLQRAMKMEDTLAVPLSCYLWCLVVYMTAARTKLT